MYQQTYTSAYFEMVNFMLLINLILMVRLIHTKGFGKDRWWILKMLLTGSACGISDALCVKLIGQTSRIVFYVLNASFFVSYAYISFIIFSYTLTSCIGERKGHPWFYFIKDSPLFVIVCLTVISYWTGWVFDVDENCLYTRGPGFYFFYGLCVMYNVGTLVVALVFMFRKDMKKHRDIQPILYSLPIVIGTALQAIYTTLPYSCMGLTVAFLVLFMNNQELLVRESMQKVLEQAKLANESKTSFFFNMSHDIRTPMNAIIGFTTLLEKEQEDPVKRQDYLDKIKDSSSVLLSIINNVLEMARIEKGSVNVELAPMDLKDFYESMRSVFSPMMKDKGIEYKTDVEIKHRYVRGDSTKLREIFINLISNAYKYTPAGGSVTVKVFEKECSRAGCTEFCAVVSDTGIGMSEDFIPHLFEEFTRERNSTETRIEGTGLGMPIVKKLLVDLMGGTIDVKSKKGCGTEFTLTLVLPIADESEIEVKDNFSMDLNVLKGKRFLIAEDNDLNAEIGMSLLEGVGVVCDRACNGEECLSKLEASEPGYYDLVLMDVQMPLLNGYEATKRIRSMEDKMKAEIPILAMTANAFEEDRKDALECGMNGHIAKPIDVQQLFAEIRDVL